jgi:glycosyltransferase involved in cell wall biosynthesis
VRVLYYVERFWPYIGGVEVHSSLVLPELARRGYEITVLTSDGDELPRRESFNGIDVRRYPISSSVRSRDVDEVAGTMREVAALRDEVRPELVHVAFTGPGIYFAVKTAWGPSTPTIVSFHGSWPSLHSHPHGLVLRAIREATWLTACSDSALADMRELDESIAERSSTLILGLDPPAGVPAPPSLAPPVLLCVARLMPEKGIDIAIEAFARVHERFPEARLVIAGGGHGKERLVEQVAELGLGGSVEFLGWTSPEQTFELIRAASAVLVPSRREGFGMTALEAMLCCRPIVATRVGGLPDVVGDAGLLVPPDDPAAFAEAIAALLSDPARAVALGAAGRARALARFPLRRSVDAYETLYRQLAHVPIAS